MTYRLDDLRTALRQVFAKASYVALASALATIAFLLAVWFPNLGVITEVFASEGVPFAAKFGFALSLLGGIATNFSALAAAYTIAITVQFGIAAAMITYLLRQKRLAAAGQNIAIGSGAMASGVLGVGCAACGSLILGGVLPSLGATAALAALPLQGEEFGILSVALLFGSLLLVSKNIAEATACRLSTIRKVEQ